MKPNDTKMYVYGSHETTIEQINNSTSAVTYLHHDQQGSTRLLTGATGIVSGSTTFDAYGNKIESTGTRTTPLGYDGQYTSTDTGLIYLRARTYDPATSQFLTLDPIEAITEAPYSYGGDSPLNSGDPTGLIFGIEGTPSWSEAAQTVVSTASTGVNWAYNNSGAISKVASAAALIPGVDVVATPVALLAGSVQAYKDVHSGNYLSAAFDAAGVAGGGLALEANAESQAWRASADQMWSQGYLRPWAINEAALWAQRFRAASFGSFALSSILGELWNPTAAYGQWCAE